MGKKADLMLHCGGYTVERDKIYDVLTPDPTRSHFPIAHGTFVETVETAIENYGWKIEQSQFALAPGKLKDEVIDGARMFGLFQLVTDDKDLDFATIVGMRNSHDMSVAAGLCCGSHVFVCDNLAFSAEITVLRKHTRNAERDLEKLLSGAIGQLGNAKRSQEQRIAAYKNHQLTQERAHHLMVEMLKAQVFPPSKTMKVLNQWEEPDHEEFTEHGDSAWRLFNAVTDTARGNVFALPKRTMSLHGILDSECAVELAA